MMKNQFIVNVLTKRKNHPNDTEAEPTCNGHTIQTSGSIWDDFFIKVERFQSHAE